MTRSASYRLILRILGSILVGGLYYLIAHYVYSDSDAEVYGIWIAAGSSGILILQYLFQKFRGMIPRILISILAGGLFYLIAHFVFSYRYADSYGILIAVVSIGFVISQYLARRFPGVIPRIVISILAGGLSYLSAHFVFPYSHAARLGIIITVACGGFFIFEYLFVQTRPEAASDGG